MSDEKKLVEYAVDAGVATITLVNPPANAYSHAMMRQLDEAILQARFDDGVHVIVLTGSPPERSEGSEQKKSRSEFFCAGADIAMLDAVAPSFKYHFCLHANETLSRLEQTPKLVIAALNGHTVGGGLEIALACDLRVARRGSFKVGLPEVNLGVLPGTGGTQRLARALGKAKAIELMALGANLSLEEASALGLITCFLDGEDGPPGPGLAAARKEPQPFLKQAQGWARQFCPPGKASLAVGRLKRAVQSGAEVSLEAGLALERELQQQLFQSLDAKEGIGAYNQRRKPEFQGR
jgi:enoyl-CoA hydratase/carnithine racemase